MRKVGRHRNQAGFSLIELMIVLGAIAAIIGVISLGSGAINSSRLSATEQDIRTLQSAATAWAAQQATPTYNGVSVTVLKTAGILPTNATGSNPWGNAYTVSGTVSSLTVSVDMAAAGNCTTLSGRLGPAAASTSCTGSTLSVTF